MSIGPSFSQGGLVGGGILNERTGSAAPRQLPPIVFAIDDRYARPLCAAIRSLAAFSSQFLEQLRVYLLYEELSAHSLRMVRTAATATSLSLHTVRAKGRMPNYGPSRWPSAAYLRLAVPALLPEESVALYLDADVLILADLRPLLTMNLHSACVGAARDPLSPTVGQGMLSGWKELGFAEESGYFNSGVLLINLDAWRTHDIGTRCHEFLLTYPQHISHPDQDALNYVLRDSWVRLNCLWNVFAASALVKIRWLDYGDGGVRQRELLDQERRARILHFAGPKPWLPGFPSSFALDVYRSFEHVGDASC